MARCPIHRNVRVSSIVLLLPGLFLMAGTTARAATPEVDSFQIELDQQFAQDVAPAEEGARAVVLFESPGVRRLALVDTVTRSVVDGPEGTFDNNVLPFGGAVVGRSLYVSSGFQLIRVDLDTKLVTILYQPPLSGTRPLVSSPVAVTANRRHVYTISRTDLLRVDTVTDEVVVLAQLEEGNYGIAVSPDEQRVYVADSYTGLLSRFDTAQPSEPFSSSFVTSSGIENSYSRVTVGVDGLVYVGYVDRNTRFNVSVLDPLENLVAHQAYPFFSTGLDLSGDGTYLLTGEGSFIEKRSLGIVARARTGVASHEVHVAAHGGLAFVSNYNSSFVTVVDLGAAPLPVAIGIQTPGFQGRPDKSRSRLIRVAVLSGPGFDAATVDPSTVCFGSSSDPDARACTDAHPAGQLQDIDGDGDLDRVLHFQTGSTGIVPGDRWACLTARTYDGVSLAGCGTLKVVSL